MYKRFDRNHLIGRDPFLFNGTAIIDRPVFIIVTIGVQRYLNIIYEDYFKTVRP